MKKWQVKSRTESKGEMDGSRGALFTAVLSGVSAYLTWQDMKDYYNVEFCPIPHFMVDDTSITYYNEKGEMLVKENHAAFYEAVKCNRKNDDEYFKALGDCADLNGDVGQQWLALYACRDNKEKQPILAVSLKVVTGSNEIPAGYSGSGIHMFGSGSAFNLNNKLYDWNQSAKKIFVHFQLEQTAPVNGGVPTSGTALSAGWIALISVGSAIIGAVITAVAITASRKKKKTADAE